MRADLQPMDAIPLTLADLEAARARIAAAVLATPLWLNDPLSRELAVPIHFKLENLQPTGSFKLRGATHKIDRLLASGRRAWRGRRWSRACRRRW